MKLPNWLHRKLAEDYDTDRFDSLAAALEAQNDALYVEDDYHRYFGLDPHLASLATPTFAVKPALQPFEATPLPELKERWDKANETLFPPESIEGAHTRGYWEGRAEAAQEYSPKYRVEVIRDDPGFGAIDEVLLHDATRCLLHLERLDNDHWWMTLSPADNWDDERTFDIFRVKKCVEVTEQ